MFDTGPGTESGPVPRPAVSRPGTTDSPADHAYLDRLSLAAATTVACLVPLAVWPGLERPFSTPKLVMLGVGAVLVLGTRIAAGHLPDRRALPLALAWLGSFGVSALTGPASADSLWLAAAGALWFLALGLVAGRRRTVVAAHAVGVTLVAAIALSQRAGVDPLRLLGWAPVIEAGASRRLAVYSTMGNPNFVAALLAPAVLLTLGLARGSRRARWLVAAAVVQGAAVAATGSRGGACALGAGLMCALLWAVFERRRLRRAGEPPRRRGRRLAAAIAVAATGVAATAALVLAVAGSPDRTLGDTLRGRWYIWRIVAPHVLDAPLAGRGPGAFELHWPAWEDEAWRNGRVGPAEARYRGPQQHAHNDYLEALVDRGALGLVTILLLLATPVYQGSGRRRDEEAALARAIACAAVTLGVVAFVDFPLARPAETATAWMLAAFAIRPTPNA